MKSSSNSGGTLTLGLEIAASGTHLTTYLETPHGPLWRRKRLGSPPSPDVAMSLLTDLIVHTISGLSPAEEPLSAAVPPLRMGIAFWGQLDRDQQVVRLLRQNQSWSGFPLAEALSARLGATHLTLETAINAAAWYESIHLGTSGDQSGSGGNFTGSTAPGTLLYVHLGREVSAAIVQDGELLIRHSDSEDRFGHSVVSPSGVRCQCGGYGHLTPVASAQSLVRNFIGRASDDSSSHTAMLEITNGRAEALTAAQVVELASTGNTIAADIVAVAQDALALAIANAVLLITPNVIVIGGPIADSGETFLGPIRERISILLGTNAPVPVLRMGSLEPSTPLRGAYALAHSTNQ